MKSTSCLMIAAIATVLGCGPGELSTRSAAHLGQIQSAVFNGLDDYTSTHVVGITIRTNGTAGACTGTLIAANLVLTAYHCVAEVPHESVDCATTRFGRVFPPNSFRVVTDYSSQQAQRSYAVREVIGPNLSPSICGEDIALLWLDEPIPNGIAAPIEPRIDAVGVAGEPVSTVGYGLANDNEFSAGVRRRRDDGRVQCVGCGSPHIGPQELVASGYICSGDSGGPLLDRSGRVIGVTSRGPEGCNESTAMGVFTSVYRWGGWIRDTTLHVATASGVRAPDWAGPTVMDSDFDDVPDHIDNCVGLSNPDQSDLDEDGRGDACDEQQNRDCSVCRICARDSECGPGAYCGEDSRCYMSCRTDRDCPGGSTTVCQNFGEFSVCVNSSYEQGLLCPEEYLCGQAAPPSGTRQPHAPQSPQATPEVEADGPAATQTGTRPATDLDSDCGSLDGSNKGDELCPQNSGGVDIDTTSAQPTLNPFVEGGCDANLSSRRLNPLSLLLLIPLLALRNRPRR